MAPSAPSLQENVMQNGARLPGHYLYHHCTAAGEFRAGSSQHPRHLCNSCMQDLEFLGKGVTLHRSAQEHGHPKRDWLPGDQPVEAKGWSSVCPRRHTAKTIRFFAESQLGKDRKLKTPRNPRVIRRRLHYEVLRDAHVDLATWLLGRSCFFSLVEQALEVPRPAHHRSRRP